MDRERSNAHEPEADGAQRSRESESGESAGPVLAPGPRHVLNLQRRAGNRAVASAVQVQRDEDDRAWYEYLGFESSAHFRERSLRESDASRRRGAQEAAARDRDADAWPIRYIGGPPRVYEQDEGEPRSSSTYAGMPPGRAHILVNDLILPQQMSAHMVRRVFPELARSVAAGPSMLDLAMAVLGEAPPDYDVAYQVRRIRPSGSPGDFEMTVRSVVKLGDDTVVPVGNARTFNRRSLSSELSTHNVMTATQWLLAATAFVIQNSLPAARANLLAGAGRSILGMGARAAVRTIGASVRRRLPSIALSTVRAATTTYAREIQAAEFQSQVQGRGRTVPPEIHQRAMQRAGAAAAGAVVSGLFGAATGLDSDSPIGDTLGEWFRGQVVEFMAVDFSTTVLTAMTNIASDPDGDIDQRLWDEIGTGMRDAFLQRIVGAIGG